MIRLSYLGIPHQGHEIPGLCLVGNTRTEALAIAKLVQAHFEKPGMKPPIQARFEVREDGATDFSLSFDPSVGRVDISAIDAQIPMRLESGLQVFSHYLIILGFTDNERVELIEPSEFHLVKADVSIEGKAILGRNRIPVDLTKIISKL